ncbi:epidermal growth factor-like protein 7 isoform X11 [Manis javanica]|uniref:epidermal growth factor-like protein 7 isoform X11 n=1 Tax=Manis javanica TaxID=9974 RepID=UPI003C6D5D13
MGTEPAVLTGPSTGLPTAAAPGRPPPGLATPAAPAGRGAPGSRGPAGQRYASHPARTEGAASSPAAAIALPGGGAAPARQMWMNAALGEAAVPSAVSTPWAVTGASVQRGTAQLRTGRSAHPGEGLPGWPQAPGQEWTARWRRKCRGCGQEWTCWSSRCPSLKPGGAASQALPHPPALCTPQKLQLVLAPLHSLASRALEHGLPDPGSLLAHSFQQLDRIDSLSEQISFLEEQLGSCSCGKEL